MKIILLFCLTITTTFALSAQTRDKKIRKIITRLEDLQVAYLLRGDIDAMQRRWSKDYTVNNAFDVVVNANEGRVRKGLTTYAQFDRIIETIRVHGRTVIVMGSETVVPSGKSVNAGRTINRRFTDIWMNVRRKWLLFGRQASVICETRIAP
ncbi:MAG: nuclear transport factor 2 family protein [Acidobacteria bacterium]|nr:nuclear transport factor 2 family protein [Acidobacteriota bacterium]HMU34086.1 nuclear transport factor 2 family protein [Pyrinomonadaceae bacterium]